MEGKTHVGLGIFTYVFSWGKLPGKFNVIGLIIAALIALLPDIDHPKGIINQYILPIKDKTTKMFIYICIASVILWLDYNYFKEPALQCLSMFLFCAGVNSHRNGISHSLAGLTIFTVIASYFGERYNADFVVTAVFLGYGSHLIGDMFTKHGVPLLYPFSNKKYKMPLTYKVGSKDGKLIEKFILLAIFGYILYILTGPERMMWYV